MVSTRLTQCQSVNRSNLKKSPNNDEVKIYNDANCNTNLQYDQFKYTKEVYSISKKQRRSDNKCFNNAKPRNKINLGAWVGTSC